MKPIQKGKLLAACGGVTVVAGIGVIAAILWANSVSNRLTETDLEYVEKFTVAIKPVKASDGFENQIDFIERVQDSVLTIAPENKGLPLDQPREPKEVYEAGYGLCFDRSRVIEKILKSRGFETRHIFAYSTKSRNFATAFVTLGVRSHAVTEVNTERGWLVVDSKTRWISLDSMGDPRSMDEVRNAIKGTSAIAWKNEIPAVYNEISPFAYVYGLYSRHGRFYPPYNPIPDINYGELMENF